MVGYPELASAPGPYELEMRWGVFDPTMDPTREETYEFLDGFIGEMTALFPDEYFHVGGDENNGKQWKDNPQIQEFMKAHGYNWMRGWTSEMTHVSLTDDGSENVIAPPYKWKRTGPGRANDGGMKLMGAATQLLELRASIFFTARLVQNLIANCEHLIGADHHGVRLHFHHGLSFEMRKTHGNISG